MSDKQKGDDEGGDAKGKEAEWFTPPKFNHSCMANSQRSTIGDMLLIRASEDIPTETEITLAYIRDQSGDHRVLDKNLALLGFQCTCAIYTDSRNTPSEILDQRLALDKEVNSNFSKGMPAVEELQSGVAAIKATSS